MQTNNLPTLAELLRTNAAVRSYAFFSANLRQLLPQIPYAQHATLFAQAALYAHHLTATTRYG